jgi:hypothetical protein
VTPSQLVFNAGDSSHSFSFQPTTPGTSLLTLSVPTGFTDPVSQRQQLLTVVPAAVNFQNPLSVGYNLVSVNSIALASRVSSPLAITLTSSDPSRLLLGSSLNSSGVASLMVTVAANQSTSQQFYLIGLASSGTVALNVAVPGLSPTSSTVTLQPSGLVWIGPTISANVNSQVGLTVETYALDPQTLAPQSVFTLRTGLAAIPVVITSSNTAEVASPITFQLAAGSSQASTVVTPHAAGATTLTLQTPAGYATPSSGAIATLIAQ